MLFHSIVGKDQQELQSPSWFNIQEAKLVVKYVQVGASGGFVTCVSDSTSLCVQLDILSII
jgi:hypothetical protein